MRSSYIYKIEIIPVILLVSFIFFGGCEQKRETDERIPADDTLTTPAPTDTLLEETETDKTETEKADPKDIIPDITGNWTGTFDKRPTTLNITQQDKSEFKGKITISYREVINQEVSGRIDHEKKTITMKDMLHSRYRGKYSGKLSDDMKRFSGTFTMDLDGTKINFSLTKK